MFAIKITEDNMETITESGVFATKPKNFVAMFLSRSQRGGDWALIRGYVPDRGAIIDWAVLPKFVLDEFFDYDPDKIQTDWTNLVRKEAP